MGTRKLYKYVRTCVDQLPRGTGLAFYVSRCIGKVAIRYGTEVNLFFCARLVVPLSIQLVHTFYLCTQGTKRAYCVTPSHTHSFERLIF